jgi:Tol biopolymer transport system component
MPRSLVVVATALLATAGLAMPHFGQWAAPANLESLPGSSPDVNTAAIDGCASHSPDGLTIVFNSNRAGTHDLYIATRASRLVGFDAPDRLPAPVNSSTADEFCPTIARGNRLYFSSTRSGDIGDLYVTKLGPKGWSAPTSLGGDINTTSMEESAAFYEDDDGHEVMLFSRHLANGTNGNIYESVDGGPASLVAGGPDSSASDNRPSVTHDGRTIFFDSTRFGTLGGPDLWYATRSTTSEPFGQAIHLGALSSIGFDARPYISWDGTLLTFSSGRLGNESPAPDIWFSTRD